MSVIVPVYNVEDYVEKCLDSLCSQTLREIEIILINDGSTDSSPERLAPYLEADHRIKYIDQNNGGLGAARNAGLDIANGEYIGFVDSDDWVEAAMFEKMYLLAVEHQADLVVCGRNDVRGGELVNTSGTLKDGCFSIKELGVERFLIERRDELGAIVWNKIYRHQILQAARLRFENKSVFNEDILFNLAFMLHCDKVACTTEVLYNYLYRRPGSILSSAREGDERRIVYTAVKFHRYVEERNRLGEFRRFTALFLLEMSGHALFHAFRRRDGKYEYFLRTFREIAGQRVYRSRMRSLLKQEVPLAIKLRAGLFLIRPTRLSARLIYQYWRYSSDRSDRDCEEANDRIRNGQSAKRRSRESTDSYS